MITLTENEKYIIKKMQAGANVVITHVTPLYAQIKSTTEEQTISLQDVYSLKSNGLIYQLDSSINNGILKDRYGLTESGKIWPNDLPKPQNKNLKLVKILSIGIIIAVLVFVFVRLLF